MPTAPLAIAPSSSETTSGTTSLPTSGTDQRIAVTSSPPIDPDKLSDRRTLKSRTPQRQVARVKPPKESKIYKVTMAVIALRAQGVKAKEIAETLGYSEDTIRQYVSHSYRKGWINANSFNEVDDKFEYVLKHKIAENVNAALGERNEDGGLSSTAREMTIEAAKGLGLFKTHQVVKGEGMQNIAMALRVQVEMPPAPASGHIITIRPGTIGGASATDVPIDAEVVEVQE